MTPQARMRPAACASTIALISALVIAALGLGALPSQALALPSPAAVRPPLPSPGKARLIGRFALAATVTVADDLPGERKGRHFLRSWYFAAPCATGECSTTLLVRQRAGGFDNLSLRRRGPGYYAGSGKFYAPVRCGNRTYLRGALVPFTIEVHVTAAALVFGVNIATRVIASYRNARRANLTPCVGALGHDAASYHGHIVAGPAPTS
jgi:hypothetical protein